MKANELMIGDWVLINTYPAKVKLIGETLVKVRNCDNSIDVDDVSPIPLTAEILEKNGFEKVYDKYKLPNYRIKWNSYTDFYFTVFTGVDCYWNPIGLNVITGGIPTTVDYVHQLQHALRLCGIEKEIEL